MRRTAPTAFALLLLLGSACGDDADDDPSPAPTAGTPTGLASPSPSLTTTAPADLISLEGGSATVEITGDVDDSFTVDIDPAGSHFDPVDTEYELDYEDAGGNTVTITITASGDEVEDAFVGVGAPGSTIDDERYFFDPFHDLCDVRVTRADPAGIDGSFDCRGLENGAGDLTVDISGTFSATA